MRAWYRMVKKRALSPGAQAYAIADFRVPKDSRNGPATQTLGHLNVYQPPQTYLPNAVVPIAGLGGVTQGQLVGQPLFDLSTDGLSTTTVF